MKFSVKFLVIAAFACSNIALSDCATSVTETKNKTGEQSEKLAADGMILIKGGAFQMGANDEMPDESPVHAVEIKFFLMDQHEVTVADFAKFVEATGYQTEAEKFGWSGAFNMETGEWERADGADWQHPDGINSQAKPNEPVCQISWNDANAYAKWAKKCLLTEAEWEYAIRGDLDGKKYSWGDELRPAGKPVANWWQGEFPVKNTGEDGYCAPRSGQKFCAQRLQTLRYDWQRLGMDGGLV